MGLKIDLDTNWLHYLDKLAVAGFMAILLWGRPAPAFAGDNLATITVTTLADEMAENSQCSLREAIQAANTDSAIGGCPAGNGDDRILLAKGTYRLTVAGADEEDSATGDLDLHAKISISGLGIDSTIIDGNQLDRVLHVHAGALVNIEHLTIANGQTPDGADGENVVGEDGAPGGGLLNAGDVSLRNVSIHDNRTGNGGLNNGDGTAGSVGGAGAGIFNSGVLSLSYVYIHHNMVGNGGNGEFGSAGDGGNGGGLANVGSLYMAETWIEHNSTGDSGGWYTLRAIKGGDGGGLFNAGEAVLINSTISANHTTAEQRAPFPPGNVGANGGHGGGIYNSGLLTVTNSTISENYTADGVSNSCAKCAPGKGGDGGGIYNSGTVTLQFVTLAYNRTGAGGKGFMGNAAGGDGGGIYSNDTANIQNTLIGANVAAGNGPDCSATLISFGFNLVENSTTCTFHGSDVGNILNQNAALLALADNGGTTLTHRLVFGSPAVDAGSCLNMMTKATVETDQRGATRPQMQGCDIGAYEAPPFIYLPIIVR